MWKNITRPLRDLIEKRANLPTRDKKANQTHSRTECYSYILQRNLSSICSLLNYNHSEKNVFEPTNFSKDKNYQQNQNEKKSQKTTFKYSEVDDSQSICGALTGSSILVLGWYLSQVNCWKRLAYKTSETNNKSSDFYKPQKYVPLTTLLTRVAYAQPIGKINQNQIYNKSTQRIKVPKHYPPSPTAEETINVAAFKLRDVHVTALGTLENTLGIECMKEKKIQEAKSHFERAAGFESTPALFNLGLVYEQQQNLNEAAHYYSLASQKGHPEAKYNLGVLHAKGLGGLKQDRNIATRLFKEAAALGQQQALDTLRKVEPQMHSDIMAEKTNRILQQLGIHEPMTRSTKKIASEPLNSLTKSALLIN